MSHSGDFENILNFRDVGEFEKVYFIDLQDQVGSKATGLPTCMPGLTACVSDDATLADRQYIKDDLGVKTVIDLRTKTEHLNKEKKRKTQASDPSRVKLNAALAEPVYIHGLDYQEIKITGRPLEMFWLSQLSWWDLMRFLFLYLLGYRMDAIKIIGSRVMIPRGLVGLGLDTLDNATVEIRETLSLYANAAALPSVVHCTQGKDRTGLVCALVLMILGIPISAIEYDYALTDEALIPERKERIAEIYEIGLTDEWAYTSKDMIMGIEQHLNDKYGGLDGYLDHIEFGSEDRSKVRETLLY